MYNFTKEDIEKIAKAAHECNRAFCVAIGDNTQVPWEWAEEWCKESTYNSVKSILDGVTPKELHVVWARHKYVDGWTYGPVKNPSLKQHPCLVHYNDLPIEQRCKDDVYVAVVKSVAAALQSKEETLPGV